MYFRFDVTRGYLLTARGGNFYGSTRYHVNLLVYIRFDNAKFISNYLRGGLIRTRIYMISPNPNSHEYDMN